jgi:hypothetical protein
MTKDDTRNATILQRVPAILAVTANSFGLEWQASGMRKDEAAGERRRDGRTRAEGQDKPSTHR